MPTKRMRVFAGPNGSGKTTIFKGALLDNKVNLGVYVNADEIEEQLKTNKQFDFRSYQLTISKEKIQTYFKASTFSPVKRKEPDLWQQIDVDNNVFKTSTIIDSYLAADLAEFIRQELLLNDISFTYETVMSHSGKVDF
jgi:predicted ABC-type ATPase